MADQPNILFLLPDQLRPDWVGIETNVPVRTLTLNRLADRGTAFRNAVCPAPLCGPSRACIASGLEYDRCGVRNHDADYPLAAATLYQRLRDEAGYYVAGTGKFDLQKHSNQESPGMGTDGASMLAPNGFSAGFDCLGKWNAVHSGAKEPRDPYMAFLRDHDLAETHVEDFYRREKMTTTPTPVPSEAYCDNWIGRRSCDLLGGRLRDTVPAYANGWWGGLDDPEALAAGGRKLVDRGYDALKCSPFEAADRTIDGAELDRVEARVAALREAIGSEPDLMIEGHGRLVPAEAIRVGERLAPHYLRGSRHQSARTSGRRPTVASATGSRSQSPPISWAPRTGQTHSTTSPPMRST